MRLVKHRKSWTYEWVWNYINYNNKIIVTAYIYYIYIYIRVNLSFVITGDRRDFSSEYDKLMLRNHILIHKEGYFPKFGCILCKWLVLTSKTRKLVPLVGIFRNLQRILQIPEDRRLLIDIALHILGAWVPWSFTLDSMNRFRRYLLF